MINIKNVNDAKFQAMDLRFNTKKEPQKLIIETSSPKDEVQYIGEIPSSPLIDFEDIKELIDQNMIRIIAKTEEMLKIKIGPIPLEMLPKPKTQANKLKELQASLFNSLQKQAEKEKIIDFQKKQIAQLKLLVFQLKNTVSEVTFNQNAFQITANDKFEDFKRQIEQNNIETKNSKKEVQAEMHLIVSSSQQSICQGNRARKQLEDSIEKMKASLLDLKEQIKKSDDKSLLDRVKYEGMISSQKEQIVQQNGLILALKNTFQQIQLEQKKKNEQQQIDKQLYEKLVQNLVQTISKEGYYYGYESSKYQNKKISMKEVEEETVKYLNYLKQNIKKLPPQHQKQLFFLSDIYNSQNQCIINQYNILDFDFQKPIDPQKFTLSFYEIKPRIDLKQLVSFDNWNHLGFLSFGDCEWFNNDDWRVLVEHATNFNNMERLNLKNNKISSIKEGDIEKFKSLKFIDLGQNPLSEQSKKVLLKIQKMNNQIEIQLQ